jgi:hypothetical protein
MRRLAALLVLGLVPAASAGATTLARVTLPQMERSSSVVFVGVFESAERIDLGGNPGVRYRLRAERFLRGGASERVHLSTVEAAGLALGVERGRRYLVFAERRRFGPARESRLTATGYHQGVYRLLGGGTATNDLNGAVSLERLSARLRRS